MHRAAKRERPMMVDAVESWFRYSLDPCESDMVPLVAPTRTMQNISQKVVLDCRGVVVA